MDCGDLFRTSGYFCLACKAKRKLLAQKPSPTPTPRPEKSSLSTIHFPIFGEEWRSKK